MSTSKQFSPVFVFDSSFAPPTEFYRRAVDLGCRMVDMSESGTTIHGGNPIAVIYDHPDHLRDVDSRSVPRGRSRFLPAKHMGVLVIHRRPDRGHVRALPDPLEFVEWFFGIDVAYFNGFTGNFRLTAK